MSAPAPAPPVADRPQMNVVIVGHVDHGKSTVVGRLFADTGALPEGKLEAVRRECQRTGKPFEYAFLLDALSDEQDQGITIDTARCFFKTARRDYIIIDAPGHIEFLKNMISGAARAEAAVLIIDAKEGVRENSRRHGYILSMLGIRQVVVCVNKMDLVGYREAEFRAIEKEYRALPRGDRRGGAQAVHPGQRPQRREPGHPRRRRHALVRRAHAAGDAGHLRQGAAPVGPAAAHAGAGGLQVHQPRATTGASSPAASKSGRVEVGDKVVFSPSNKSTTIKSIEAFNTPPAHRASRPAGRRGSPCPRRST